MATTTHDFTVKGKTFLGHPRGLLVLFFTEMWERFSYYGMRALLVLYLIDHFGFTDTRAYMIYGAYTALAYITPVIGGNLADRWLGARKAVLYGAILLTLGHFLLGFEGERGQAGIYLSIFYLGLGFIVVGVGFLKANISTIVGSLYPRNDPRRDPAFTIFYMGINVGGALGPLIAGFLGQRYGWSYGFGAAGVGMLLGLLVFIWGKPALLGRGEPPVPERLKEKLFGLNREWIIYLGGIAAVVICWQLVQYQELVGWLLGLSGALLVCYILYSSTTKLAPVDRDRIFAALFLIVLSVLFWALFEQAGSSLNVYTDRQVDRTIFGVEIPASMFQSINSIYIVLLAPLFAWLWTVLGRHNLEPSTPAKFGLAMIQLGAGFLVLVAGAMASEGELTPVIFIFLIYLLHTMGEICLSPVGLSAMTKMALPQMVGLIMGTWFFATSAGNFTAGLIAQATGAGENVGPEGVTSVYSTVGWIAVATGVAVILISPLFKRLMHLDTLGKDDPLLAGQEQIGEPQAPGMHTERETR
ncbi:MFS transporter [Sphingomonas oleivorans]|uniref:MFS transporter n=1 Tax=Sphingomonas oleivorans TaxID=1735121 RepID=A0A2T5FX14_9SPHN|nr:peptide MFS transporter [Sphingomonas oleivorans]PTQ10285.1 MFS transporter [Sphingomonas oleivorans]